MMGVLLILHGLAHASAGMWATDIGGQKLVTLLWEIATLGFMAAGAGLIGIDLFHRHWKTLTAIASVSSLALLLLYGHPLFVVGIAADFTVMGAALLLTRITSPLPPVPKRSLAVHVILMAIIAYVGTLIALRPWYSSWGTTRSERQMVMIGDPPLGESHFRIDHAVTINAPADSVWPWLAQIGQDRGGFYSYDWLERTFGARIHNANAVVPAWQTRNVGDKVRAVQPTFLGGIFGNDVGWKITQLEPGRAIVLENWGAFVVDPIDAKSSRLHIRTRGPGVPTVAGIALSPISLLTFEPAHFIMERGMLLGIKKRAESASIQ
jgi:hypothetical protein